MNLVEPCLLEHIWLYCSKRGSLDDNGCDMVIKATSLAAHGCTKVATVCTCMTTWCSMQLHGCSLWLVEVVQLLPVHLQTIKGNAGSPSADANTGTAEANTLAGKQDEGTNSAHGTAQLIASSTTSTDSLRQQLPQKNSAGSSWLYAIGDCKSSALQVPPRAGSKSKVHSLPMHRWLVQRQWFSLVGVWFCLLLKAICGQSRSASFCIM